MLADRVYHPCGTLTGSHVQLSVVGSRLETRSWEMSGNQDPSKPLKSLESGFSDRLEGGELCCTPMSLTDMLNSAASGP